MVDCKQMVWFRKCRRTAERTVPDCLELSRLVHPASFWQTHLNFELEMMLVRSTSTDSMTTSDPDELHEVKDACRSANSFASELPWSLTFMLKSSSERTSFLEFHHGHRNRCNDSGSPLDCRDPGPTGKKLRPRRIKESYLVEAQVFVGIWCQVSESTSADAR